MKKTFLFTVIFCTILLSGCPKNAETPQKTTVTVETHTSGNVYLVKINNSNRTTIKATNTGKVESTKDRAVAEENLVLPPLNDNAFIRKQNQRITDALARVDTSRAAGDEIIDYSELGESTERETVLYSKGQTGVKFHSITESTTDGGILEGISHQLSATCYYVGDHCYVFGDDSDNPDDSEKKGEKVSKGINLDYTNDDTKNSFVLLGKEFDKCYEQEIAIIGDPKYNEYRKNIFVPCNNKVVILVSDLYGDAKEGQDSGVVGYFYNADMYNQTFLDENVNLKQVSLSKRQKIPSTDPAYVHSNEAAMFYVDSNFLTNNKEVVYTTLVHEFNHMINFIIKTLKYMTNHTNVALSQMSSHMCDTWFTEMLAMTTEDMFCDFMNTKFDNSPMARLPIFDLYYHYGFRNWDSYTVSEYSQLDSIYVSYANTYAFGAFLARNYGGTDFIKEIAQSEYVNEQAIDNALKEVGSSYKEALKNFALVLINTATPNAAQLAQTGSKYYYSLNRSAKKTGEKLYFNPINLNFTVGNNKYKPEIYTKTKSVDLGPNAFSVHHVGFNIKSFELTANTSDLMSYYLVEFN